MTEFTYYTNGNAQDPEEVARIQHLREMAEQQAMQQSALQSPPLTVDRPNIFAKVFFLFFISLFFIPVGLFGYRLFSNRPVDTPQAEDKGEVKGATDVVEDNDTFKDKLFFVRSGNVFISDKNGKNKEQLTSYSEDGQIQSLQLIDGAYLGYFKCESAATELVCNIIKLEIATKKEESIKQFVSGAALQYVSWADSENFAYAIKEKVRGTVSVIYESSPTERVLLEYDSITSTRRSFIEDDQQLTFSPNKQHLYYINTQGKEGFDFTIYVYDVTGSELDIIEEATMPAWLDDETILYRAYSNSSAGNFYKRDIEKRMSDKLITPSAVYSPQVWDKKVLYWEAGSTGSTYVYNLSTGRNGLIDKNTAFGVWLSENEIIYANVRACQEGECIVGTMDYETQFTPFQYKVKNINTEISEDIDIDPVVLRAGFVTWYHRHQ